MDEIELAIALSDAKEDLISASLEVAQAQAKYKAASENWRALRYPPLENPLTPDEACERARSAIAESFAPKANPIPKEAVLDPFDGSFWVISLEFEPPYMGSKVGTAHLNSQTGELMCLHCRR